MQNAQTFSLSFTWTKPEVGYVWEDCEVFNPYPGSKFPLPKGPFLVEKDYTQRFIPWTPFDDPTLFARFADLDLEDRENIVEWANVHGRLLKAEKFMNTDLMVWPRNSGTDKNIHYDYLITEGGANKGKIPQAAESEIFWIKQHRDLKFTVAVWEHVDKNDIDSLGKIITWYLDKSRVVIQEPFFDEDEPEDTIQTTIFDYRTEKQLKVLFDGKTVLSWASYRYRSPDVIGPAKLYVQTMINEKLIDYPLRMSMSYDEHGTLVKKLEPTSLLSAMWYQLYLANIGEIRLRRCDICGEWENMSKRNKNWTRHKTCASRKRVQRFRENQEGDS